MHPTWLEELVQARIDDLRQDADRARLIRHVTQQPDRSGPLPPAASTQPSAVAQRRAALRTWSRWHRLIADPATPTPSPSDDCEAPVRYEIRIQGQLDQRWSVWFEGLTVTSQPDDATTLIAGSVADQAALHGLLAKVRDLGLPLISVNRIEPQ